MAAHIVCVLIDCLRIESEANRREHWRKAASRKAHHRQTARLFMQAHARPQNTPISIKLTRIAPRVLDDDNLASGFKAARDGVADWLGIDDGDKRLSWSYDQRKGNPGQYAAEVLVEWES